MLTTILILILIIIIYKYYKYYTYWQRMGIPAKSYPDFSWIHQSLDKFIEKNVKKYGRIFGVYGILQRAIIIEDPKIVNELSIKELYKFPKRFNGYFGQTSLIHSLFMMEADNNWKRIRTIVSPAFTSVKLRSMITPINFIVNNFIENLQKHCNNGEYFDIKIYTSALAMDVIAKCAYGIEVNSIDKQCDHPLLKNAQRILSLDVTFKQSVCFIFPFLAKLLHLDPFDARAAKYFDDLTYKIIDERLKYKNQKSKDLIGLMVEQTREEAENYDLNNDIQKKLKGITRKEIAGQGIIFFLAGYDTTNVTICHIIYYLIKNPEWQTKLFNELKKNFTKSKSFDYETLRTLPILNAIILETLRLKPPLISIQRTAINVTKLLDTNIIIPANATIIFHPFIIHRLPEYYPDPETFKPERFIGPNSMESSIAYMPFGVGPRLCVGMRFAQNELRATIAALILNYHLQPDDNLELDYFKGNLILSPKKLLIKINKR